MATTTNYGWTTPDDTALVKDGAAAIRALGTSIDTSMNTALGTRKSGLVLINTTSFTGVSSQSINSVFTSTYDHYKILINITTAASSGVFVMRMRAAGVDTSGTNYRNQLIKGTVTTTSTIANTSGTDDWYLGTTDSTSLQSMFMNLDLFSPNLAANSKYVNQTGYIATNPNFEANYGVLTDSTQYDGFTLIAVGNVTGTVSTYGYNK